MDTINISSDTDDSMDYRSVNPAINVSRRRSSIFRPNEDYSGSAFKITYPEEYKGKLEEERKGWVELYNSFCHEYNIIKKKHKHQTAHKIDKTILSNQQKEFLENDLSLEHYLTKADNFLKKVQLFRAIQRNNIKAMELERKHLLSKISYVENMLVEHLLEKCSTEE